MFSSPCTVSQGMFLSQGRHRSAVRRAHWVSPLSLSNIAANMAGEVAGSVATDYLDDTISAQRFTTGPHESTALWQTVKGPSIPMTAFGNPKEAGENRPVSSCILARAVGTIERIDERVILALRHQFHPIHRPSKYIHVRTMYSASTACRSL
jgi:hypothetical protein